MLFASWQALAMASGHGSWSHARQAAFVAEQPMAQPLEPRGPKHTSMWPGPRRASATRSSARGSEAQDLVASGRVEPKSCSDLPRAATWPSTSLALDSKPSRGRDTTWGSMKYSMKSRCVSASMRFQFFSTPWAAGKARSSSTQARRRHRSPPLRQACQPSNRSTSGVLGPQLRSSQATVGRKETASQPCAQDR